MRIPRASLASHRTALHGRQTSSQPAPSAQPQQRYVAQQQQPPPLLPAPQYVQHAFPQHRVPAYFKCVDRIRILARYPCLIVAQSGISTSAIPSSYAMEYTRATAYASRGRAASATSPVCGRVLTCEPLPTLSQSAFTTTTCTDTKRFLKDTVIAKARRRPSRPCRLARFGR